MKNAAKIVSRDDLPQLLKDIEGRVGYTSGVFDILHPGHLEYLEKCKDYCDILIVGVNSDSSVRQNKGDKRPILDENSRTALLAGLAVVDFVFLFSETNNNKNVEVIKPHVYLKAGDYSEQSLSSGPIVEKFGGKVVILPFKSGYSTSTIIDSILLRYGIGPNKPLAHQKVKAAFIDRDGTMVEEVPYLHEPEKIRPIKGAFSAIKRLQEDGYKIIIVTNQPGIGLGYFTKEDFFRVTKSLFAFASQEGVLIDKVYFCPHSKSENCSCRKPSLEFVERAKEELAVDISKSVMIGDSTSDMAFGKAAGMKSILVKTGSGGNDKQIDVAPDFIAADICEAVEYILKTP